MIDQAIQKKISRKVRRGVPLSDLNGLYEVKVPIEGERVLWVVQLKSFKKALIAVDDGTITGGREFLDAISKAASRKN